MKILIADDERMARLSLSSMLEELYPGSHEYFYASNGKEAVERTLSIRPELVFLDVRMPVMDGLEALKQIRTSSPDTAVIILSGYSDFDYARTALSFNAADYLLKPASLQQVKETTDKALESIHSDRMHRFSDTVSHLFAWNESGASFAKKPSEVFRLYLVFEDEGLGEHQTSSFFASFAKSNDFGRRTLLCSFYLPSGNLCFASVTEEAMAQNALFREQIARFNSSGNRRATILIAEADSLKKLRDLLPELEELSDLRYTGFVHGLADYGRLQKEKITKLLIRFSGALHKFMDACLSSSVKEAQKWLSVFNSTPEFEEAFKGINPSSLSDFLDGILGTSVDTSGYQAFVQHLETYVKKQIRDDDAEGADLVETAKRYVKEHYSDNFSIASLSEKLSITPAYLSRIFHQRTGEKLIDYITKQRIYEAQRILRENPGITLRRLAEIVGYSSTKHLNSMFLKVTGCTPAEYVKRIQKD